MKKMMIILMIMTACLASPVLAAAPTSITNSSFEVDVLGGPENPCDAGTEPDTVDFWITWGESARDGLVYHTDDPSNAHTGSAYFEVGRGSDGWAGIHAQWGEEVAVIPDQEATLSVYARSADGTEQAGAFGLKFEFYETAGECWADGDNLVEIVDVTGTYTQLRLTTTVPDGMFFARATITSEAAPVYIDDVSICVGSEPCETVNPGAATLVAPAPSGTFVDPASAGANDLTWLKGLAIDPNDDAQVTSNVWYSVDDPDPMTNGTQILTGSLAETVNIVTA